MTQPHVKQPYAMRVHESPLNSVEKSKQWRVDRAEPPFTYS